MEAGRVLKMQEENRRSIESDLTLEQVKHLFLSEDFIIPQSETLYRMQAINGRFYIKLSEEGPLFYPSVTSVISACEPTPIGLAKWMQGFSTWEAYRKALNLEAAYGTLMHIIWAEILLHRDIELSRTALASRIQLFSLQEDFEVGDIDLGKWVKNIKQDVIGFIAWCRDYEIEPVAIEISLTSEKGFAGSLDLPCMARVNQGEEKERILVDFKKNRNDFYRSNVIQLSGYRDLWNENYPDYPIFRVYNYGCKDFRMPIGKSVVPYRFEEQTGKYDGFWSHYLEIFKSDPDNMIPKVATEIKDTVVNLKTDIRTVFQTFDPKVYYAHGKDGKAWKPGLKRTETCPESA